VQNKLHWAITGQTATELIYTTANATKLFMGLTTHDQLTSMCSMQYEARLIYFRYKLIDGPR
jgi:hypothetical protein